MSAHTDKHRETAEQIEKIAVRRGGSQICADIEEAISAAEECGMKRGLERAAEIATGHAAKNGPVNEFDDDGYWQETTALTIAAAILSEAGEG